MRSQITTQLFFGKKFEEAKNVADPQKPKAFRAN
jgi:hypothetical protein